MNPAEPHDTARPGHRPTSIIEPAPSPHDLPRGTRRSLLRLARFGSAAFRLAAMRPRSAIRVTDPHILRTRRLVLRPIQESDQREFIRVVGISREHLGRYSPLHREGESDQELFTRYLAHSTAALATGRAWRVGAFSRAEVDTGRAAPRLIGLVNLNDLIRGLECQAEANWWIAADCLRRGFAAEAVSAVVQHAFSDLPRGLGLQRVVALITPENIASLRVAQRAGFVRSPEDDLALLIAGQNVQHQAFTAYAPLNTEAAERLASQTPSPFRRGLANILSTESAVRRHVLA